MSKSTIQQQVEQLELGCAEVLPVGGLAQKLELAETEGRPLRVKLGIDPSGAELTLGHAVVLRKLRQFQNFGHTAVLVVGDFTGRVGDPTGRASGRTVLSPEQTRANAEDYFDQVMRILDRDRTEVRHNTEWLEGLPLQRFLESASALTVAQMLERDDFSKRHRGGQPISLLEFLYPILQGYDSVALEADIELGGTDQTYNNLVGRVLQRQAGQPEQAVVTVPLLVGTDGVEKMGKSAGNWIGIREPAHEQFGKLMSIPDEAVRTYAELCADYSPTQVDALQQRMSVEPAVAKRDLAEAIVSLYHGDVVAKEARDSFDRLFKHGELPSDLPLAQVEPGPVDLAELLVGAGMAKSKSEVRRLVAQGGLRLDGVALSEADLVSDGGRLDGSILQRGKRQAVRLALAAASRSAAAESDGAQ